ncbi:MAG TPA: NifB/NifX family molybdenum-iron cluster-binding protein [Syntrophorhabdales bacterium]|nr:NifB/NifX family molybdenum-iron cluster-binding protein [Syntrophorhabdales bacterium]
MEKVGICYHMGRISPVLDVASNMRVYEVENGRIKQVEEKVLTAKSTFTRAQEVSGYGIATVICGAISRPLEQAMGALGVNIIGFVCGSIEEVIKAYADGFIQDEKFLMPGCCGHARQVDGYPLDKSLVNRIKRGPLKIAVASIDGTLEGPVDERFGRCRKLVIYAPHSNTFELIDNGPTTRLVQGAGVLTAQQVINAGAHAVISGDFGPKTHQVLRAAGIEVYSAARMSVREALALFEEGKLRKVGGEDVQPRK